MSSPISRLLGREGVSTILICLLDNEGVSQQELQQLTKIGRQKTSRLLELLEVGGLVQVVRSVRNTKDVRLTRKGKEVATPLKEAHDKASS